MTLIVHDAGPGVTVQDLGRPGTLSLGMSRGGASDRLALAEGAALLGQGGDLAAIEMQGIGGTFEAAQDLRIALTGAPMRAALEGASKPLVWGGSHSLPKGARLTIGPVTQGMFGYLHVGGGIDLPRRMGARGTHLNAGLGAVLGPGERLPTGPDSGAGTGLILSQSDRFGGGEIRILEGPQTAFFATEDRARFERTRFARDARGNRMGCRIVPDGDGFETAAGRSIVSEIVVPGDVQITGDGTPFVLLAECQTTGGYPRIGTVLPCDLPRVVQAQPGEALTFRFVGRDEGLAAEEAHARMVAALPDQIAPLVRDPQDIGDLLSYQLISGAISGED